MQKAKGFTLVELMISVAIIAFLGALAFPSYTKHVKKSRRTDAYAGLQQAAATQERWFAINRTYSNNVDPFGNRAALPSPEGYYTISNVANGMTYTLTATPVSTMSQASDTDCTSLSITHNGRKTSVGGRALDQDCWR
jgi:type IV pilus assembly protein PilE